ncbi:MAG: tRNA (guanine-N(7)-)-methyltransferase [Hyphobacterium sp.]|nr:MAG: tRNA (guanine-N(7)-)-methyltransferase [Hyphobacterium sp.]
MSDRQQGLVDTLLPEIGIPAAGAIDPSSLLPGKSAHILEIGFGGGEHLTGQAARNPQTGYLGVEPFINGVAKALSQIDDGGLGNVRLMEGDARDVMERMPDQCLERIFLLFPDPWPKAKHAKRRFVQTETAAEFVRLLKPGGMVRVATDVKAYADHALWVLRQAPHLEWKANSYADWRTPPVDHLTTRYETKRLGDCAPVFFDFIRV